MPETTRSYTIPSSGQLTASPPYATVTWFQLTNPARNNSVVLSSGQPQPPQPDHDIGLDATEKAWAPSEVGEWDWNHAVLTVVGTPGQVVVVLWTGSGSPGSSSSSSAP